MFSGGEGEEDEAHDEDEGRGRQGTEPHDGAVGGGADDELDLISNEGQVRSGQSLVLFLTLV